MAAHGCDIGKTGYEKGKRFWGEGEGFDGGLDAVRECAGAGEFREAEP